MTNQPSKKRRNLKFIIAGDMDEAQYNHLAAVLHGVRETMQATYDPFSVYLEVERDDDCRCVHPGEEDGPTTCWVHHDCRDGSCTHGE